MYLFVYEDGQVEQDVSIKEDDVVNLVGFGNVRIFTIADGIFYQLDNEGEDWFEVDFPM